MQGSMTIMHSFTERLRPIIGLKSWDYFVFWRFNEEQRSLELMDCCCGGTENNHNGEELFLVSSAVPCRNSSFQHRRTKACELLAELPSVIPLDSVSSIYAETLISNEARWFHCSPTLGSNASEESLETRILIPVPVGLVELFVSRHVPEDQQIVEFITAQCNISFEQEGLMVHPDTLNSTYSSVNINGFSSLTEENQEKESHGLFNSLMNPTNGRPDQELPCEVSMDRVHLNHSQMDFSQHLSTCSSDKSGNKNDAMFFEGAQEMNPFMSPMENGHMIGHQGNMLMQMMEPALSSKDDQGMNENDSYKQEIAQSNSASDSDPNEDDDDAKYRRRRTGKEPQSKNLVAERKRRKKLNDRLYKLRSLVPNISKLDRASILGDAIEYVKELQKQAKDLENELEENSDDEDPNNISQSNMFQKNGTNGRSKPEHDNISNGYPKAASGNGIMRNQEHENSEEKVQQMEPQVEVIQLDGNEFFVKVFCEHKHGGFVRLMEALNALGLEVINVNATRHTCLVSYIFRVERKDCDMIQADDVRESLLELTRNPSRQWSDIPKSSENGDKMDLHQAHHHHHHHLRHHMNPHHLHHHN